MNNVNIERDPVLEKDPNTSDEVEFSDSENEYILPK